MREAISEGYKTAMKARDQRRTATLRAINAAIKDKDIAARGEGKGPLSDQDILALLQKMVKQREESFAIYANAGRNDLATVEKEEIDILNEFLPKALSDAEVDDAGRDALAVIGGCRDGLRQAGQGCSGKPVCHRCEIPMRNGTVVARAALIAASGLWRIMSVPPLYAE